MQKKRVIPERQGHQASKHPGSLLPCQPAGGGGHRRGGEGDEPYCLI